MGNYDMDNHLSTPPLDFPSSSEEDEEQATDTGKMSDVSHKKTKNKTACPAAKAARPFVSTSGTAGSEGSDANDEGEDTQSFKPGRLPVNAIQKAQALGKHMTEEALSIANEYGKSLGTIMAAAGLSTKATQTESVWNMHQAWYADVYPKTERGIFLPIFYFVLNIDTIIEHMKAYQACQLKHYEMHKDNEEHAQLWKIIRVFWIESIAGIKDVSAKGMVGWLMSCRDSFAQAVRFPSHHHFFLN